MTAEEQTISDHESKKQLLQAFMDRVGTAKEFYEKHRITSYFLNSIVYDVKFRKYVGVDFLRALEEDKLRRSRENMQNARDKKIPSKNDEPKPVKRKYTKRGRPATHPESQSSIIPSSRSLPRNQNLEFRLGDFAADVSFKNQDSMQENVTALILMLELWQTQNKTTA